MLMKKKSVTLFSISFIDCITCGLGAMLLLFVIVNARSVASRSEITSDVRGEVDRIEQEVLQGKKDLVQARNTLVQTREELVKTQGLSRRVIETITEKTTELSSYENDTLASKEHINRLKADLKAKEEALKRLEGGSTSREDHGAKIRQFPGEGDRQYLTGLKMGGQRILILIDTSASMLDDTILGIIRRRNMADADKRKAAKWRHAVKSIDWLTTQLPLTGSYQVYRFSETAAPVLEATQGKWLDGNNALQLNEIVNRLHLLVPQGGTSLINAAAAVRAMAPPPDNIFLLTDGLPTMGRERPWGKKVSGEKRLDLFNEAVRQFPAQVPVNTILYHMEGDPAASSAYWRLAMQTGGSFFSPSRDWP
jgi:hypothetical protein